MPKLPCRAVEEVAVLHEERLVEAELLDEGETLGLGVVLSEEDVDGIADVGEQGEGDETDDQEDGDGLEELDR